MKKVQDKIHYFFVDESGDPVFYDRYGNLIIGKEGVSKTLILGFILVDDPKPIRFALSELRHQILKDKYLQGIPSLEKTLIAFHAKDDCPEVRERVFRVISKLDFTVETFVARKISGLFVKRHHRRETEFYDDLISKLFENKLHLARYNKIYFAVRGNRPRQSPIEQAIKNAVSSFEKRWKTKIDTEVEVTAQSPSGEPCLQVIDYVNWSIQRAFEKGQDRFFKFIDDKIAYLVDIYDTKKYPKNFYNKKNKFELTKISPL